MGFCRRAVNARLRETGVAPVTTKGTVESKERRAEAPPPAKEFVADLGESGLETMRWLDENPQALEGYEGKWVVAANRKVCFAGDAADEAIAMAEQAGILKRDMVVSFVEDSDRTYGTPLR